MREVTYTDPDGRKSLVWLPPGVDESQAGDVGAFIGPPKLASLGLPRKTEIALHNELFNRGLIREVDCRNRRVELEAAIRSVFRIDAAAIHALYVQDGEMA